VQRPPARHSGLPRDRVGGNKRSVLGIPNSDGDGECWVGQPAELLAALAPEVYDRLHPAPVGDQLRRDGDDGWVCVAELLVDPDRLAPVVDAGCRRFGADDRSLVVAQVGRETIGSLTALAVALWVRQRRLFDLTAANVVLRGHDTAFEVALLRPALAVLADDPLVGDEGVEVVGEAEMLARLVDGAIGHHLPVGRAPSRQPRSMAAVAAIIATIRRAVRCGERHLWGTAALAAASAAARLSHTVGPRADHDLAALLAARPDLSRMIELVTVDDAAAPPGTITFALRRTCCLLYQLPDASQCGTCSLRDRELQIARLADWHRDERRRLRTRGV
jgi:FhuF 2Fe-2S C-terminal domain